MFRNEPRNPIVTVCGNQAEGKTHLAISYATQNKRNYHHIWFVNAEDLEREYRALASFWGLSVKDSDPFRVVVMEVHAELNKKRLNGKKSLIIFDNASRNPRSQLVEEYPDKDSVDILITSKQSKESLVSHTIESSIVSLGAKDYRMTLPEGMQLLRNWIGNRGSDREIKEIVDKFKYLPFLVAQAGYYIASSPKMPVGKYLTEFDKNKSVVLGDELCASVVNERGENVVTSLKMTFSSLKEYPDIQKLLLYCSWLGVENMPISLVLELFNEGDGWLRRSISQAKSLLIYNEGTISMHGIFQELLSKIFPLKDEDFLVIARACKKEKFDESLLLYSLQNAEVIYSKSLSVLINNSTTRNLEIAHLKFYLAEAYRLQGRRLQDALDLHKESLEIRKELAPNSTYVAASYLALGNVYNVQGKLEDAYDQYKESLEIYNTLEPNSLKVAAILTNIGTVYHGQGKLQETLVKYTEGLKIREELAPNSLDVAMSYNNIGGACVTQEKFQEALDWHQKSLKIRETLVPNSLDVAASHHNIGVVYFYQGKLLEAMNQYRQSLAIKERIAPNSLATAVSYNNIGEIYYAMGQLPKALAWYQKARKIREDLACNKMPVTSSYNNIGLVFLSQGEPEEAKELFEKALSIGERDAAKSSNVATSHNNLGEFYRVKHDLVKALEEYSKALAIQKCLAPEGLSVALSHNNMGQVYLAQGELDKALEHHQKALQIRERDAPEGLIVAASYGNIGKVYEALGNHSKATEMNQKALKIKNYFASLNID